MNDDYASEVVSLSVIESLLFDEDVDNASYIQFVKANTGELIKEIIHNF